MKRTRQSGIALVTTLIILLLLAALLAGFTMLIMTDLRLGAVDRDRTRALYAAQGGMEKLNADLGALFLINYAPTGAQINALTNVPAPAPGQPGWPTMPGINFVDANLGGVPGSGYNIAFTADALGNPLATTRTILSGPYQGFVGLITPYTVTITAQTTIAAATQTGSEVRIRRTLQTVGIPVFQFGVFSQTDLSFFNGPVFNFGGRVHTNANLWVATGSTTTFTDRVTAVGEVIRTNLSNGWGTAGGGYNGNISMIRSPGVFRNLLMTEGSLVNNLGSAQNEPTWTNNSIGTYNGNLRNGRTGARVLNLPLVSLGAQPIDLIQRPRPLEDVNNPSVFAQRYFTSNLGDQLTSLRILLSDTPAQISTLPTITATAPVLLGNLAVTPIPGYTVGANASTGAVGGVLPPFAISPGAANGYTTPISTPLIDGYLKIEMQDAGLVWQDVTLEILNLGVAGRKISSGANKTRNALLPVSVCTDQNPDAVIRFQRLRDDPSVAANCGNGSTVATDYWPMVLFDSREGTLRDTAIAAPASVPTPPVNFAPLMLGGVIHYIELDMNNLRRWFAGQIGVSGTQARNLNGYVVYFSDRRTNRNPALVAPNDDTGEYGFEDFVNRASATGTPDGALELFGVGEDLNGNGVLETYGQVPVIPAGSIAPLASGLLRPWSTVGGFGANNNTTAIHPLRVNKPLFFRRALKLVNGTLGNLPPGITIASENPVYIEGNFNANAAGFGNPHVGASVIADAVTLLSSNWNDLRSFLFPYVVGSRLGLTTWYRVALVSGKGMAFQKPTVGVTPNDFGTDGGVHNFLRYLEAWGGQTLNYRGSIVSFYYNRQAIGTYKCCTTVYGPPTRGYNFDIDFLTPTLLPPRTPMFRDVNVTGFTQLIMPWQ